MACVPFSACYPEDGTHLNELLDKVDRALNTGKDGVVVGTIAPRVNLR